VNCVPVPSLLCSLLRFAKMYKMYFSSQMRILFLIFRHYADALYTQCHTGQVKERVGVRMLNK